SSYTRLTVALKKNRPQRYGAIVVPSELNAWARFKRLEAVSGAPSTDTYGFAETCSTVMPAAKTINAARNNGKDGALAAGMNNNAPNPMVKSPATMLRL